MPDVRVTRSMHFSAAHRLYREDWSEQQNAEVFGEDCSNPNWHGHNYRLDVSVAGPVDPETGFVINLRRIKEIVQERIVDDVDHRNLTTEVPWMEGTITSTENLVVAIWARLLGAFPDGVRLERLVLWETSNNYVEYTGG